MLQQIREGTRAGGQLPGVGAKKVFIPPMAYGSGRAFAAAFRAIGMEADITSPSDNRTRELGAKYTSGDECYPAKVTVGDFMKVLERPEIDPSQVLLFMPTADGPCRFGQYAPYLKQILRTAGYPDAQVLSPSSKNGYDGLGETAGAFVRTGWRALLSADILQKLLLRVRPYELKEGKTEQVYEACLDDLCHTIETTPTTPAVQIKAIRASLVRCRDRFRSVPTEPERTRPLIGVVGEIFCRLNTFSNEDLVRRLEDYGGEAWISDLTEWVWYTNAEQFRNLRLRGKQFSTEMLSAWIRNKVQQRDEHVLLEPFHEDFRGREEPSITEVLEAGRPYLPNEGCLGEMVLNVGKAVCLARRGVDGVIDISPFTCMNGIVSEAIYPRLSKDLGGIPIRNFYFDGTQSDLDRDLGVYIELARAYQRKRQNHRAASA